MKALGARKIKSMETINISAVVKVCLSEYFMSGREGYKSGIRPNHIIAGRDYTFIGQLDFIDHEGWLKPGDCCNAIGRLLIPEQDVTKFKAGFTWHITEAGQIVGYVEYIDTKST